MLLDDNYAQYLQDESREQGWADKIFFPKSEIELKEQLSELYQSGCRYIVQGARTGFYGAAVPHGEAVINLSEMTGITAIEKHEEGDYCLTVLAGTAVSEIIEFCKTKQPGYFFPVEPSEETATIGGIVAQKARGISIAQQGGIEDHILAVSSILPDGSEVIEAASSYYDQAVAGKIITSLKIRLMQRPVSQWGMMFFMEDEAEAVQFSLAVKALNDRWDCIFYSSEVLWLIDHFRNQITKAAAIPPFPDNARTAIYLELSAADEEQMEEYLMVILELFMECGGDEEDSWAVSDDELEKLRMVYHFALELEGNYFDQIRSKDSSIKKYNIELVVKPEYYLQLISRCRKILTEADCRFVFFGIVEDCHLHLACYLKEDQKTPQVLEQLTDISGLGGIKSDHFGYLKR